MSELLPVGSTCAMILLSSLGAGYDNTASEVIGDALFRFSGKLRSGPNQLFSVDSQRDSLNTERQPCRQFLLL
jgi:hypothetical protein